MRVFIALFMVAESPGLWDWGDFSPPNPKDPRLLWFWICKPPTIQNNTCVPTYTQRAPTHNMNNKHMASHKSTWRQSGAFTGTCVNTGFAWVFQLHPLPSLSRPGLKFPCGVCTPLQYGSGSCCETAQAVTGIQPLSPSCWPLDPQVLQTCGPAPVAHT